MSPGFNYFLLLRDDLCVGVLVVIKCIYLPLTYLHFIQDIEERCLLQTSSNRAKVGPADPTSWSVVQGLAYF
jgi:hypothetical protein